MAVDLQANMTGMKLRKYLYIDTKLPFLILQLLGYMTTRMS